MIMLDVIELDEFTMEHIPGSALCSMSLLNIMSPGILKNHAAEKIVVMCRSGNRARWQY